MNLQSSRLTLSEITWDDLEAIHLLHTTPEVDEYNCMGIPANQEATKEIMRPYIEAQRSDSQKVYAWKISLKDTGDFIGMAGFSLSLDKFKLGEIWYKLLPNYWGRGYATEIAKLLIKTGFEEFKLHKVEAGVATGNERSIRVLEKCGMTQEGLRRKVLPIRGEWVDNFHYAIIEDDPRDY